MVVPLDQIIPSWQKVQKDLQSVTLSDFTRMFLMVRLMCLGRIEKICRTFGREKLLQEADLLFRASKYFIPVAEFTLVDYALR